MNSTLLLATATILFAFSLQAVLAQGDTMDSILKTYLDEIAIAKKNADSWAPNPGGQIAYIAGEIYEEWVPRAVSLHARKKWAEQARLTPGEVAIFDQALNSLSVSLAKKIPTNKPRAEFFAFRNQAEEEMMKAQLENLNKLEIHKIGLLDRAWQNGTVPYKMGYVWARNNSDDHSYCHLYSIIIRQEYAGGGNYNGSGTASLDTDTLVGCP